MSEICNTAVIYYKTIFTICGANTNETNTTKPFQW